MADQPERDFVAASTHGRLNGIPDEIAERDAPAWRASMLMQQHYLTGELDADRNDHCVCGRWASGKMSPGWDDHLAEELAEAGLLAAPAAAPVPQPPEFVGHQPRACGEHRPTGSGRAWCFDCSEWCYPDAPCANCSPVVNPYPAVPQGTEGGRVKSPAENLNPAGSGSSQPDSPAVRLLSDGIERSYRDALIDSIAKASAHEKVRDTPECPGCAELMACRGYDEEDFCNECSEPWPCQYLTELADAVARVPHPDTAEAARLRQEQEAHRIAFADAMGAGHEKTIVQLVEWATDLYREWGKVIADRVQIRGERDQAVAALESAQRQMTRFEVQRDEWKAALGVYQGDIDTTPAEAVANLLATRPKLPETAIGDIQNAIAKHTGWVTGETANAARDVLRVIESFGVGADGREGSSGSPISLRARPAMSADDLSRAAQRAREAAEIASRMQPPAVADFIAGVLLRYANALDNGHDQGRHLWDPLVDDLLSLPSAPDRPERVIQQRDFWAREAFRLAERAGWSAYGTPREVDYVIEFDGQDEAGEPLWERPVQSERRQPTDDEMAAIKAAFETGNYLACDGEYYANLPTCEPCEGTGKQFKWDDLPDCPDCGGMGKVEAVDGIPLVQPPAGVTCAGCGTSWEPGPMVCPECDRPAAGLSVEGGGRDGEA